MTIEELIAQAESGLTAQFARIDRMEEIGTRRVLDAFREHQVAYRHFAPTTGYGYDDVGRDTLEKIFAELFGTQAAIVRPQIASGTHAISLCLFGLVLPGDDIVSATGMPYDTLQDIIGWGEGDAPVGSLREMSFHPVALRGGKIDLDAVENAITPKTKLVIAQRSRGYDWRPSLMPEEFAPLAKMLHEKHPGVRLMVDNCYGEFVCEKEPSHYGADVCVGSLIKNPGGGLAPTGGYIVGTQDAVERIAYRLTAPGIGLEVGSYAASYQPFYQGLFMAPHTVAQAIKTACLAARVFEILGMTTTPAADEPRADIIQAIQMRTPERLVAFCQGIQMASPIDSMALPEPWDMPGYNDQVVMAAGTFVAGASIELSADAPMREPYTAYMQGGLTYTHGRIALQMALNRMVEQFGELPEKTVMEKDMLFATLETSVRSIDTGHNKPFFLTDTVGFIHKLPHGLVKAFRSTLEEVKYADLLVQVVDFSDENYRQQMQVTADTLKELGAGDIPQIVVYNKADKCGMEPLPQKRQEHWYLAAGQNTGIRELAEAIEQQVYADNVDCTFLIPYSAGNVASYLMEEAQVFSTEYREDGILIHADCHRQDMERYKTYMTQ